MVGAEEAVHLVEESLVLPDPQRMIDAVQLDVAHVREMLGQVPAIGRGDQEIITPVHYQARCVHGRAQAPYLDRGRHPDDGIGCRRAGAVALEARDVGHLAFGACRGGEEGRHELAGAPHLPHGFPRRRRVREHVDDGERTGVSASWRCAATKCRGTSPEICQKVARTVEISPGGLGCRAVGSGAGFDHEQVGSSCGGSSEPG
jgi:hypothetical protein